MIIKELKISKYTFDKQGKKRKTWIQNKNKKEDEMEERIQILENQLIQLFKLINNLNNKLLGNDSVLISDEEARYRFEKLETIKQYLIWICKQLKMEQNKNILHYDREHGFEQLNSSKSYIDIMDNIITNFAAYNTDKLISLRIRTKRSAEHVDSNMSSLDYGSFLEIGLHAHKCILFELGFQFTEKELLTYLKSPEPNFISFTILASFGTFGEANQAQRFRSIFKKTYLDSQKLVYQTFESVSFDSIRALILLLKISANEFDLNLIRHLFPIIMRMAYSLEIDKIDLTLDVSFKTANEIKLLIKKRKLWNTIMLAFSLNQSLFTGNQFITKLKYCPSDSKLLYEFDNKYSIQFNQNNNNNNNNNNTPYVRLHVQECLLIISKYIDDINYNSTNNIISYEMVKMDNEDFQRIQQILDIYFKPSVDFIAQQLLRQTNNQAYNLTDYYCKFTGFDCENHKDYNMVKHSTSFYLIRILSYYPNLNDHPRPIELPIKYLLVSLDAAIRVISMYQIMIYFYFNEILQDPNQDYYEKESINDIQDYLKHYIKPIVNNNFIKIIPTYLKSQQLESLLYSFYVLLITLNSNNFQLKVNVSFESITFLKNNIKVIMQLFKLFYNFKYKFNRLDIEFIYKHLKDNVYSFDLVNILGINWDDYFKGFLKSDFS